MPTTQSEAEAIMKIATSYVPVEQRVTLFKQLHHEVGEKTDNDSLKVSLRMLYERATEEMEAKLAQLRGNCQPFWKAMFVAIVALHTFVVCAMLMAFIALPLKHDPWVAVPLNSIIFFLTLNRKLECPLTAIENAVRVKIGLKPIGGFIGHYFIRPWRK